MPFHSHWFPPMPTTFHCAVASAAPPPVWLEMGFRRRRRRELFYVLSSSALFGGGGGGNGDSPRAAAAVCLSVSAAPGEWMCGRASLAVAASAANPFCPPATLEAMQFD